MQAKFKELFETIIKYNDIFKLPFKKSTFHQAFDLQVKNINIHHLEFSSSSLIFKVFLTLLYEVGFWHITSQITDSN